MKKSIFSIMFAMVIGMMIGSCTNGTPASKADDVDSTIVVEDTTLVDSTMVVADTTNVDSANVVLTDSAKV